MARLAKAKRDAEMETLANSKRKREMLVCALSAELPANSPQRQPDLYTKEMSVTLRAGKSRRQGGGGFARHPCRVGFRDIGIGFGDIGQATTSSSEDKEGREPVYQHQRRVPTIPFTRDVSGVMCSIGARGPVPQQLAA